MSRFRIRLHPWPLTARIGSLALAFASLSVAVDPAARAHRSVERHPEVWEADARLLVADSASGDILAVDLPAGVVTARVSTPPYPLSVGLSPDGRYVLVFRGRNTDRDWVTVLHSGFDPETGEARRPYVVRTLLGHSPGGVYEGRVYHVGRDVAVFMEDTGELLLFQPRHLEGFDTVPVRRIPLAGPDHYHFAAAGAHLFVGYLRLGVIQVLDRESGAEVSRIPGCPVLHGVADDDRTGRLFWGCQTHLLVVGTQGDESARVVARIPYPTRQRIATFHVGEGGVLWGSTEGGVEVLHRLDPSKEPYALHAVPLHGRALRVRTTDDGRHLLVLTFSGTLQVRDGGTGELRREIAVSRPFDPHLHEHTDKASLPDVVARGTVAWISLPHEGRLVEADVAAGMVKRVIETGGEPTRLVLAARAAPEGD